MVSIHKRSSEEFDFKGFLSFVQKYLPHYAVPKFIRFITEFSFTATHKIQKVSLKNEGFNINALKDPLFVLLPESSEFVPLSKDVYDGILEGKYRF
jgi:fatty-acyl-CoA synthase